METVSLSFNGIPEGDHKPHPTNEQSEHQDTSPTDQVISGGAHLDIPVHTVANTGADTQDDSTITTIRMKTI